MKKASLIICGLVLLICATPAPAQRILGEFTGTVTDPNGGSVVGAKVTALDPATGRTWMGQTNEGGGYRLVSLPPGTRYDVTVERQGFKTARLDRVALDVGEAKRLDFSLEVGQVSESVLVSSAGSQLNLERGEVSAVVTERKIVDLPLNGRNIYHNWLGTFSATTGLWSNRLNFGRSTLAFDARQIQFGLKFAF